MLAKFKAATVTALTTFALLGATPTAAEATGPSPWCESSWSYVYCYGHTTPVTWYFQYFRSDPWSAGQEVSPLVLECSPSWPLRVYYEWVEGGTTHASELAAPWCNTGPEW